MRYTKPFDISKTPESTLRGVQPGQWVFSGSPDVRGRFWGVKPSGSVAVAWLSASRRLGYQKTNRLMREWALGR